MAHVVLLRGMNVGGHRRFRPAALASELAHLDVVNIGAAGTFVVRRRINQGALREEFARRLPFSTEIVICPAGDFARMQKQDPFEGRAPAPGATRFVSVLARPSRRRPAYPKRFPDRRVWLLMLVRQHRRYIFGEYRRHMRVIGYLHDLDREFGVPLTTRSWTTVAAIARVLEAKAP